MRSETTMTLDLSLTYAQTLDAEDELARYRAEFIFDDPDLIYLDGNSLGRLPKRSAERVRAAVEHEWGRRLIRSWNEGWLTAPQRAGAALAPLLGAQADEVIVADSVSVNFYKLALAALRARPERRVLVTDDLNFPSDIYLLQGIVAALGPEYQLKIVRSTDGQTVSTQAVAEALGPNTALLTLSHVAFKSGFLYDLPALTECAHRAGAWVLWDLSHSAGAVPVALNTANAELAVGCTYKYLNAGPGAPAFLYVRRDLQEQLLNPIWGWFGQRRQFEMSLDYAPGPGLQRFLVGTPGILSLAGVEPAAELLREAGLERLRAKSMRQTDYLIALWETELQPLGVTLNSPRDPARRGAHVALGHPEGLRLNRALIEAMHVIPDFRYPDNIRLGLAPLYTAFVEVHEAVRRLKHVLTARLYEKYPSEAPAVT
jgi:kynureninase